MKNLILILSIALISTRGFAGTFQQNIYTPPDWTMLYSASTFEMPQNPYSRSDEYSENSFLTSPKANLHCKRACGRTRIKKPFVFVEGISFDLKYWINNTRPLNDYLVDMPSSIVQAPQNMMHLQDMIGYGTFNWATLCMGLDADGWRNNAPLKVEKIPQLLNRLEDLGYDVFLVDFESGERYIQSNGAIANRVLTAIHDSLEMYRNQGVYTDIEPMVVCGASMGGLVARYAINRLEAQGHGFWVSHFISFDSPQMGANIPLGLQCVLNRLSLTGISDIEMKYKKLTCPSASQLVNYSCLEIGNAPLVLTTPQPSQERTALLNSPYMGWPQYCRKISISNGSRNGMPQSANHQPGDKIFDLDTPFNLDLWTLPANESDYNSLVKIQPPLCNLPFLVLGQTVKVRNTMALDLAPGSYREDIASLQNELPLTSYLGAANQFIDCNPFNNFSPVINHNKLCFIPTASSIGVIPYEQVMKLSQPAQTAFLQLLFNGQARREDPQHVVMQFDVAYAPEENQTHVEITDENIEWVISELADGPLERVFANQQIPGGTYVARNLIQAGWHNSTTEPCPHHGQSLNNEVVCGPCRVVSGQSVYFKSWGRIELKPGFSTEQGAHFVAEIIAPVSCANRQAASPVSEISYVSYKESVDAFPTNTSGSKSAAPVYPGLARSEIRLFPNPATENIFLEIPDRHKNAGYRITNARGMQVHEALSVNNSLVSIDTKDLPSGMYFVQVFSDTSPAESLRFVKR